MSNREKTTHALEGAILIQAKISGPDTLLKLYVAIDEDLTALQPSYVPNLFPAVRVEGHPIGILIDLWIIIAWRRCRADAGFR